MSDISDEELDSIVRQIVDSFPSLGRRMISGHLKYLRYRISRARLQQSYHRVHGPPVSEFGVQRIER